MKIHKLRIKNFKCFKNLTLETSNLTLLTGANSSGKSSVLYSILGPIQSGEFPLQFSPNGKYVRMGDFNDIVHNHNSNEKITIEYDYFENSIQHTITTVWIEDKVRKLPVLIELKSKCSFYTIEIIKRYKYHLSFIYNREKDPRKDINSPEMMNRILSSFKSITKEFDKLKSENKDKDKNLDKLLSGYTTPKKTLKFSFNSIDELSTRINIERNYYFDTFFKGILHFYQQFDRKSNFISSFRLLPERTYYETSKTDLKIGKYGENYVDQIILWESRKSSNFEKLKTIIRELKLFYDF
ncbi:MAG: ATP-binding protein, partial [Desulfobacula sp.]|nr:ATP-binding protein [Desulfobacula sp.]